MEVRIEKSFRSAKYQRIMLPGEIIKGTKEWAEAIVKEGFGVIVETNPAKRTKKINKKEVETAALEVKT